MPICRPKHQILILKCYPKGPKDNLDVKPNSSELSYLLYYATTRRTKLQKIGPYLTKKTDEDIAKKRYSHISVTLQIYAALIAKSPKDLPLYVRHVLNVLTSILRSEDLGLIEASIPTFEAFCAAHDGRNLAADSAYLNHYEHVVRSYTILAVNSPKQTTAGNSKAIELRWRIAGLHAAKAVAGSEALSVDTGHQLAMIIPVMLQNLHADRGDHLAQIQKKDKLEVDMENEKASRPRASFATTRTTESISEKPGTAAGTTAEADLVDEQDIGVLALRGLRKIFEISNRGQTRNATVIAVNFIVQNRRPSSSFGRRGTDWGSTLLETITNWVPPQDRYIVLVATVQTLVRNSPSDENQLILVRLIDWLLCSKINLIGLSVMDILVDLINHMRHLLRLPPSPSGSVSKATPSNPDASSKEASEAKRQPSPDPQADPDCCPIEPPLPPTNTRVLVIQQLKICLGSLGTHIYYTEQIPDMVTRLLNQIRNGDRPTSMSGESPADHSRKPALPDFSAPGGRNAASLPRSSKNSPLDERVLVLEAIKEVLIISNSRASNTGGDTVTRNRVTLQNWEGSEILLESDSFQVRLAYVDALVTWLRQEVGKGGWKSLHERSPKPKGVPMAAVHGGDLQKHMFTAAAYRERSLRRKGRFLQLLHISIYDCSLRYAQSEHDMLLIHLLLFNLIEWLSVLEISVGLPMIMQLQDDLQNISDSASQIRLASVVHAYLFTIVDKFSFAGSPTGREIQLEVTKRKERKAWCDRIRVSPMQANAIASLIEDEIPVQAYDRSPFIRRFDNRSGLVDQIALSYNSASQTISPPTSPGRNFARPILSSPAPSADEHELPIELRSEMQAGWSKEALLASIADEHRGSQKTSLNSRNGGSATNLVEVGKGAAYTNGNGSMAKRGLSQRLREVQHGRGDTSPTRWSDSSRSSTLKVDDLKRILAGAPPPSRSTGGRTHLAAPQSSTQAYSSDSVSSLHQSEAESMKDVSMAKSELAPPVGLASTNESEPPSSRDSEPIQLDLSSFAGGPPEISSPKPLPSYTDTTQSPRPPLPSAPSELFKASTSTPQLYQAESPPMRTLPNSASLPGAFPQSPAPSGHQPRSSRDHVGGFVFRNSYFEAQPRGDPHRNHENHAPIDMSDARVVSDESEEPTPIGRAISPDIRRQPPIELPAFTPSPPSASQATFSAKARPRTADASRPTAPPPPDPASPPPIPAIPRERARSTSGAPRDRRLARSRSRGRGDRSGITSGLGQMGAGDVKAFLSLIDVGEERPRTGVARPPY